MTTYYARVTGSDNTAPRKLAATRLALAKIEAADRFSEGYRDDYVMIERENADGGFVIVAGKLNCEAHWDNLSLVDEE